MMVSPLHYLFIIGLVAAETGDLTTTERQSSDDNCSSVRAVTLGIHGVYDHYFLENRKTINATENITEYLSILLGTAARAHLGNLLCAKISLVLTGASVLNQSDVVEPKYGSLEAETTLSKFREFWSEHRAQFEYADVGVLFTPLDIVNTSEGCTKINDEITESRKNGSYYEPPGYRAYCVFLSGAAYYKGICGNNSVAVVQDKGGVFEGTSTLAKALLRLLGVDFDIFKDEAECRGRQHFFLTASASRNTISPDPSPCAKNELTEFIDCTSNLSFACWNDTPKAAVTTIYKTPFEFLEPNNFCRRYSADHYQCNATKNGRDYEGCKRRCCYKSPYSGTVFVEGALSTPYGKTCGIKGMCFYELCAEQNGSITYYDSRLSRYLPYR